MIIMSFTVSVAHAVRFLRFEELITHFEFHTSFDVCCYFSERLDLAEKERKKPATSVILVSFVFIF